jgi:hypothetical protein
MQYRSQAFEPGYFAAAYDAMSPAERQALVDAYVREEAMAREALTLGLDRADYVIRQRLIQKMLFLADGIAGELPTPGEAELKAYFEANSDIYRASGEMTFTHVFIDSEVRHAGGGKAEAERVKARLEARHAGFNDAPQYGDRFPYLQNYVGRSGEFVANQFGAAFAGALAKLAPSEHWQGPIQSQFGWHIVLLTRKSAAGLPDFETVRGRVEEDYRLEQADDARNAAIDDLVGQYDVRIELPAGALPESAGR